ncbi:MAG: hypothetical protein KDD02_21115 [Phaeodactylibacter sp.]|nr:hypothetical protein [Phaeodactylibacter sp.]MCB9300523.1 hypothetical protein [Lewinellaceae bacterium]HQU61047.1 hypothetical protein [Saprospiraceae bacterium]
MSRQPDQNIPLISPHLLWEYDLSSFDFDKSKRIVIERVIERGTLEDWREMIRYYGEEKVLLTARQSKQLSEKDKGFTEIFIHSTLLYAA